jgi:hypothetical protein
MPEPGLLPLGVLPRADRDRLRHGVPRALPVEVLDRLPNADAVEPGRVRRVPFRQHGRRFLDQSAPHHLLGPPLNPRLKDGARRGEDNVPWLQHALRLGRSLPPRERVAREKGDLDDPRSALASPALVAGIEAPGPAYQIDRLEPGRIRIERAAARRIDRRLGEESVGECPHVEAGAADIFH